MVSVSIYGQSNSHLQRSQSIPTKYKENLQRSYGKTLFLCNIVFLLFLYFPGISIDILNRGLWTFHGRSQFDT